MKIMTTAERKAYADKRAEGERNHEKWAKFYADKYDYITTDHGVMQRYKDSIESEFWYNDEYDSPLTDDAEQRKAYFMKANIGDYDPFKVRKWQKLTEELHSTGCCSGRRLREPFFAVDGGVAIPVMMNDGWAWDNQYEEYLRKGFTIEPMTADDLKELEEVTAQLEEAFRKRLEAYWKRYSHKVCAHGYWTER